MRTPSVWERIKARWRRYQTRREIDRLLRWKTEWRPFIWTAFLEYKYQFAPHKAVKGHVAGIIMPTHHHVFYRPGLTPQERRLVAAMALKALERLSGRLSKPYVILTQDLVFPDGPEDNQHWIDWIAAMDYLAPIAFVDYIAHRYPKKAERYVAEVFDLSPAAAKHRMNEHRMWLERNEDALFQPAPMRLTE